MEFLSKNFSHLPQIVITWGIFFIAGGITFLVYCVRNRETLSVVNLFNHCFPFNFKTNKSVHMDVKIYVIRKLTDHLPGIPSLIISTALTAFVNGALVAVAPTHAAIHPGYLIVAGCTVTIFMLKEFSDYFVHYVEHKVPVLWELHKVHHSAEFLNPLTSKRGHSLALVYAGISGGVFTGLAAGLFMFMFGMSLPETMILSALASKVCTIGTLDPLKHSHFPISLGWFDRVFISPHMHQLHHSKREPHWDKNFGTNLSIYDWLFGTAYKPEKNELIVYGLAGYDDVAIQQYHTLMGVYVQPLVRIWRLLTATERPRGRAMGLGGVSGLMGVDETKLNG